MRFLKKMLGMLGSTADAETQESHDRLSQGNSDSAHEPILDELDLTSCNFDRFEYPEPIERWTEELESVGFDQVGDFQSAKRGFVCRGLIHTSDCLIAILYEKNAMSWGEMLTPYEDDTYHFHTANILAIDDSPEWQTLTSEDVEPDEQYELVTEDREEKPMLDVTQKSFLSIVCKHDQRIQDWRRAIA